jgi:hypothetical protein
MNLSPEQKQAVSSWVAAGDSLSVIQKKLAEQFKVSMTYMDVRFLVDDLGLELKNAVPKADASDVTKTASAAGGPPPAQTGKKGFADRMMEKSSQGADEEIPEDAPPEDEYPGDEGLPTEAPAGASTLKLEVDRIVRPGAVVSGGVTFSDGVSGKWALDQHGRLMLETGQKGYQPSPADVQAFQRELSSQLQRAGF